MKSVLKTVVVISVLTVASVSAQAAVNTAKAMEIANKNACLGCHAVDKKLVGPAYKEVAAKYKTDKNAVATVAKNIKAGGSGKWGPVAMPAQAGLSDADAKLMAEWVLAGAPK